MTKEELREYRMLALEKKEIEQQIGTIEVQLYNPKIQQVTDMPKGPGDGKSMEDVAIKHMELLEMYQDKLVSIAELLHKMETEFQRLPARERVLARSRYVYGMTWEEICVEMHYSWRQVHRIHANVLRLLRDV